MIDLLKRADTVPMGIQRHLHMLNEIASASGAHTAQVTPEDLEQALLSLLAILKWYEEEGPPPVPVIDSMEMSDFANLASWLPKERPITPTEAVENGKRPVGAWKRERAWKRALPAR